MYSIEKPEVLKILMADDLPVEWGWESKVSRANGTDQAVSLDL